VRERGFTLVETIIAATIFAFVFGAAAVAVARDQQTHRVISAQLGPELVALNTLDRIATEMRMAGEWAEDRDHDGELDPGEDGNGNGILDAAWDVPDGAVNQDHVSFNRRIDLRNEEGETIATGVYSRRVTYRLDGTSLVREWEHEAGGEVQTRRAVIARRIGALRFTREGLLVKISLDVLLPKQAYDPGLRTLETRVWLRN
jgi:prepilin-type N-terminal cleavage/methylation domain-containing protein